MRSFYLRLMAIASGVLVNVISWFLHYFLMKGKSGILLVWIGFRYLPLKTFSAFLFVAKSPCEWETKCRISYQTRILFAWKMILLIQQQMDKQQSVVTKVYLYTYYTLMPSSTCSLRNPCWLSEWKQGWIKDRGSRALPAIGGRATEVRQNDRFFIYLITITWWPKFLLLKVFK